MPFMLAMSAGHGGWSDEDPHPGFGPGGPFGPHGPFGPKGPFGPRGGFGPGGHGGHRGRHGGRARRGDVRNAILHALATEPMNGYQIIQFIESQTSGQWRPSPGAVYPALSQLEDEEMIAATDNEGQKAFELTAAGLETVEGQADRPKPWEFASEPDGAPPVHKALYKEFGQLAFALQAVARTENDAAGQAALDILSGARRDLYRLLADDIGEER
jgi:DNA-binding PadR family transcriptional regulator